MDKESINSPFSDLPYKYVFKVLSIVWGIIFKSLINIWFQHNLTEQFFSQKLQTFVRKAEIKHCIK